MKLKFVSSGAAALLTASAATSFAQDYYVSASGGLSILGESDNAGAFDGPFTTGEGTTLPAGAVLPDGTPVGWSTEFDTGYALAGALGKDFGWLRGEIEVAYQSNGIDSHAGVSAGGIALDGEDAGVLITGSPTIGVTVGDLVANGRGDVSTLFVMANVYYDLDLGGRIKPYVGGGAGIGFSDVDYSPSGVSIIEDDASAFAYQAMAGIAYGLTPSLDLKLGYRYRATSNLDVEADLFSADFDIENRASIIEAGLTYTF